MYDWLDTAPFQLVSCFYKKPAHSGMKGENREETPKPLYHEAFPAHTPGTIRVYRDNDMKSLKKVFNPLTEKPNLLAVQSIWPTDFRGLVASPTLVWLLGSSH